MHNEFSANLGVPSIIRDMAQISSDVILPYFRKQIIVENKLETTSKSGNAAFDPVTKADKAAEVELRRYIRRKFPDHGILGEEYGGENLGADYVWVLDPIDGTRAFVSGLPLWGTLIALCHKGNPILGAMVQPYLDEIFVGDGQQSWLSSLSEKAAKQRLHTRSVDALDLATIFTTEPALFISEERRYYEQLENTCQLHRYGLDCYGYAMVAGGFGDLVVEAGLQIYDIAALIPIIEGAGGVVTNWDGATIKGIEPKGRLQVLASANQIIHKSSLDILNVQHQYQV